MKKSNIVSKDFSLLKLSEYRAEVSKGNRSNMIFFRKSVSCVVQVF